MRWISVYSIRENGCTDNRIITKTDNENAIQYAVKELVEARQKDKTEVRPRTLVESSVEKDSKSNGMLEVAVQDVEGVIRGILLNMETKMGADIDSRERIIAFIPEYAAYLMKRLREGEDGKIAYERLKGKKPSILGLEFGEKSVVYEEGW